jgi:class 3 adenylate cyclase/PAS domain-containing protein
MRARLSVRWRLLLAFLGISAFAVLAAAAGTYAFRQVAYVLDRITEERVPSALTALDLSRQAERIVAAAPTLLTARSQGQYRDVSTVIMAEVDRLEVLLSQLRGGAIDAAARAAMEPAVEGLRRNLRALDQLVARRLEASERKENLLRRLSNASVAAQRLVAPGIVVIDSRLAAWRRAATGDRPASSVALSGTELAREIASNLPMQKAQLEFAAINDGLFKASAAETLADLPVLNFPLNRSLTALRQLTADLTESPVRSRFEQRVAEFAQLIDGPDSIVEARRTELALNGDAERLLAENTSLSKRLTAAVDGLVSAAGRDIREAGAQARTAQRVGRGVLIGVVVLSLLSSILIVWLYVDRNLVARLRTLSDSMLAIAGGNLRAPLPSNSSDEIGQMVQALAVFRDTAIEVEEKNLREVAKARQRLIDAIESISEGFALYDADDRLILFNSRYRELLYSGLEIDLRTGMPFESIVRRAAELGYIDDAVGRIEEWVAERLLRHRKPGEPEVQRRANGRWIMISERRTDDGGTVAVYSDITELKQREESLAKKSAALEALSTKLAKYLAPQVYSSIFTGRQEVEIASKRKKLTVCFSDVADFTEITEKMESEDLTQLLNQYLTEMSNIALKYGATIDKYVGDAILMFFGDPESRGVRNDAVACVKMALAMQKRMGDLAEDWRDIGIETPLRCRIGIHTGYCTVGNFGSEDRMDYTIVGGAVNLASRLEHEAPPGGVLISYETFAHVKDDIHCEERGQIRVKGISYPVATYGVLALKEHLATTCDADSADHPHFRLEIEPELMSPDELHQAAIALREALGLLEASGQIQPRVSRSS